MINPECKPRNDDNHEAGDVHGDHEVGKFPCKDQIHLKAAVLPCKYEEQNDSIKERMQIVFKEKNNQPVDV